MKPTIIKASALTETLTPEHCYIFENWGKSTGDEQVSIARARVEAGITTVAHSLEGIQEIYLIVKGKGVVHIDSQEPTEVAEGDCVVIPSGTVQKIRNTGKTDLVFYCVCTPAFKQENYHMEEKQN